MVHSPSRAGVEERRLAFFCAWNSCRLPHRFSIRLLLPPPLRCHTLYIPFFFPRARLNILRLYIRFSSVPNIYIYNNNNNNNNKYLIGVLLSS